MFPNPIFVILIRLNRYITRGSISFKVEDIPTQYFDSVRLLANNSRNFSFEIGCFDVSEPHVSMVF